MKDIVLLILGVVAILSCIFTIVYLSTTDIDTPSNDINTTTDINNTVIYDTCGNDICDYELGENATNCKADCYTIYNTCGNGVCDYKLFENIYNCPKDCSIISDTCGNNKCEYKIGENAYNCPQDCYILLDYI